MTLKEFKKLCNVLYWYKIKAKIVLSIYFLTGIYSQYLLKLFDIEFGFCYYVSLYTNNTNFHKIIKPLYDFYFEKEKRHNSFFYKGYPSLGFHFLIKRLELIHYIENRYKLISEVIYCCKMYIQETNDLKVTDITKYGFCWFISNLKGISIENTDIINEIKKECDSLNIEYNKDSYKMFPYYSLIGIDSILLRREICKKILDKYKVSYV